MFLYKILKFYTSTLTLGDCLLYMFILTIGMSDVSNDEHNFAILHIFNNIVTLEVAANAGAFLSSRTVLNKSATTCNNN